MSQEISLQLALSVTNPVAGTGFYDVIRVNQQYNQNAVGATEGAVSVPTTPTTLSLASLAKPGWAFFQNLDLTNNVIVGVQGPTISVPTLSAPGAAGGGSLPSATYYYKVTATTPGGETTASGEQSVVANHVIAAPSAPTVSNSTTGGTVPAGTFQAEVTYVNANGETVGSASASTTTTGTTSTITVNSPVASSTATGWYAYVTQAGGSTYYRQQPVGSPTPIGTNLVITANPTTTGANPPGSNTAADGEVSLTWSAVPSATGYNVYRGTATGAENVFYSTATNSYTDTGAANTAGTPPASNTTSLWAFGVLEPGEVGVFRLAPNLTLQARSLVAACVLNYKVYQD